MSSTSKYLNIFADEGRDLVDKLGQRVLTLEERPEEKAVLESALRLAHTLKGSSKMVGLDNISHISHNVENLLKDYLGNNQKLPDDVVSEIFKILDKISEILTLVHNGDIASAIAIRMEPLQVATTRPPEVERRKPVVTPVTRALDEQQDAPPFNPLREKVDTLRVKSRKVDKLQDVLEDLTVNNWKALAGLESIRTKYLFGPDSMLGKMEGLSADMLYFGKEFNEFSEDIHKIGSMLNELQLSIMELRMVPLSMLFEEYRRMVRDLSKELGKEVVLVMEGEDTEVDRGLLEGVQGPLTHLLRNAVDHGIEDDDSRVAGGKPVRGTVTVRAYQKPGTVVIEVEDDGKGLDVERIKRVALQKGFISKKEARTLDDEQVLHLLCRPGFTSRDKADEVSGRGIGLDAVKVRVDRMRGSLSIHSEKGKYSHFRLFLPQSLTTLRALTVTSGKVTAAFPTLFVERCLRLDQRELLENDGYLIYGDEKLTPVSLERVFGLDSDDGSRAKHLLLISFRKKHMLIAVERIEREQELVVKSLGPHLQIASCVLGVSLSSEGRPVPIIDIPELHERWSGFEVSCVLPAPRQKRSLLVLIVDDALTSRHVETVILEELGHEVKEAGDGAEALELLEKYSFDLVMTDMEMPRIDGIELVRRIRGDARLNEMPIVMISAQRSEEARGRGYEAGVNAYLTKDRLNSLILRRTLRQLFPDV